MLPHKPDLESERIRIQDLGGLVVFLDTWRVNGVLSVARAIGDPDHKPYVIAEPSQSKFDIDPSYDFLVLGCDGLFDQLTGADIAAYVFEFLCKNENRNPEEVISEVSTYLSQMAIKEGSSDNITSIVLFFKPLEELVSTGLPTRSENNFMLEPTTESVPTATLSTNSGHFPYTDFSKLPLGSNFKLHSLQKVTSTEKNEQNEPAVKNMEENLTTSENSFHTNDVQTGWTQFVADSASHLVESPVIPTVLADLPPEEPEGSGESQAQLSELSGKCPFYLSCDCCSAVKFAFTQASEQSSNSSSLNSTLNYR